MKKTLGLISVMLALCNSQEARSTTWYVDGTVSSSGNGLSWKKAFKAIQEGIDAASNGDTVIVAEGTYVENIVFRGENIVLTSTDPLNPSVVANTIIDGDTAGSVVTFNGTEDETCVLSGFTIRNGRARYGAGILGDRSHATIRNNIIIANSAGEHGGGLYLCDGLIENNTITGNLTREYGAGLYDCDGTIRNNLISSNAATGGGYPGGGGLIFCDGLITGNTISDNSADAGGGGLNSCMGEIRENVISGNSAGRSGGGLSSCNGTIVANIISTNFADGSGGGLFWCHATIENNTITRNQAGAKGGALYECLGTIMNNRIIGNTAKHGGGLALCPRPVQGNIVDGNSAATDGGGLYDCDGPLQNNVITGNSADGDGGGLYGCDGAILNNTIARNTARGNGGGTCSGYAPIRNCIIWRNTAAGVGNQLHDVNNPSFSCIQEWTGAGEGNISEDPRFMNAQTGDFRLLPDSPCIDAGFNDPELLATDIAAMHRIIFGAKSLTVDIGAYEFYTNQIKADSLGNVTLAWSSLAGKTYSVHCSEDMLSWITVANDVASMGDTITTWIGPMALPSFPHAQWRYFRVEEEH